MKLKIYFSNEQDKIKIPFRIRRLIRKAVKEALTQESFAYPAEVSVSFVDNEAIHKLNLEYREKDRPTDVLSFPMWEKEELSDGSALDGHAVTLGDIIISAEKAQAQAQEYGHSIEREICFLSVHSVLHLLGYDHETSEEDEAYMKAKQEAVLVRIGLPRK
ncbi:MAG: rRNA maturation RNase YbeY [Clostridia bacterium]|nr:rRNA maturation RNase YbeY [Clostridia bacterium]MBR6743905.1 rRNA maturation RNase YbeY [Clostridia bacterium]